MHKSVNKLCRSYQHHIFGASQLSSEAPPACQHPSASHASRAYQHLGRLCHGQACLPRAPGGGRKFRKPSHHPLGMHEHLHFSAHILWLVWGPLSIKLNNFFMLILGRVPKLEKSDVLTSEERECVVSVKWGEIIYTKSSSKYVTFIEVFLHLQIKHCDFTKLRIRNEAWDLWRFPSLPPPPHARNKALIGHALLMIIQSFKCNIAKWCNEPLI